MFRFLGKELIRFRTRATSTTNQVYFLQTQSIESSINNSNSENEQSPTVTYLVNSCGFSLESAISASKKINIKSKKKSDSVLELFRTHGFTETQINNFIAKRPSLLLTLPNKTLASKIEFFKNLGFTSSELAKFIYREPLVLLRGLKNQIISTCNFIRSFVQTDKNLVMVLNKSFRVIQCNVEKVMGPNILTLRNYGVPESNIGRLIMIQPSTLMLNNERFEERAWLAKKMGFDPSTLGFVLAVRTMMVQTESTLRRKMEVMRSYGLTDDEILSAFKVQPMYLLGSEKKLKNLMDFFMNKLNWKPSMVYRCPNLLLLSLEKRMIPRCSVLQVLMSNGLVDKDINVRQVFKLTEKEFVKKYVTKYQEVVPEVVKAHQGKIEFNDFTFTQSNNVSS